MLTEKQKELLADKLADMANLITAAFVLGQIIIGEKWRVAVIVVGIIIAVVVYFISVRLRR